jgi:hypothetical protein
MTTPERPGSRPGAEVTGRSRPGEPQRRDVTAGGPLDLPEIVIAPAHPASIDGRGDIVFEVRESAEGTAVLPVFSSVPRLTEALGGAQPWLALPLLAVRELAEAGGIHTVVLDPEVQPGAWRWAYDDLYVLENLPGSTE